MIRRLERRDVVDAADQLVVGLLELHHRVVRLHEQKELAEFVGLEVGGVCVAGEVAVEDLLLQDDLLEVEVGGEHPQRDGLHQLLGFARHRTENVGDLLAKILQLLRIPYGFQLLVEVHALGDVGDVRGGEQRLDVGLQRALPA